MVKKIEEQTQNVTVESMSSEDLAMLLNREYAILMQSQNNINAVNTELRKRKDSNGKAGNRTSGEGDK